MSKMIIDNMSSLTDFDALEVAQDVLSNGRISNHGKQHCYITKFQCGVRVETYLNDNSERFLILDDKD